MPLKINAPYSEKDIVKAKGGLWSVEEKTWYVPDNTDVNNFLKWMPEGKYSIIIKTPFYIAVNKRECWKCSQETSVVAIASNNFYCLDYKNEDDDTMQWIQQEGFSFFSMPIYFDEQLTSVIEKLFPFYKIGYSRTVGGKYWANHCQKCSALQGDFHLHNEPGEAFCPISAQECKTLQLVSIPSKFDIKIEADKSWHSNEKEILFHAEKLNLDQYLQLR